MKLAALCFTFRRPHTLGQLIESFLRQDYPAELRELVILDDAGQYENQSGDGWRRLSIPSRFRSLGEKRNACAALASVDVARTSRTTIMAHWLFRKSSSPAARPSVCGPELPSCGPAKRESSWTGCHQDASVRNRTMTCGLWRTSWRLSNRPNRWIATVCGIGP